MKKQNPNNNKLAFEKMSIVELNDNQLQEVNGGTWFTLFMCLGVPALGTIARIIAGYTGAL